MKFCDIKLSSDGIKEAKAWEWIVRFVFGGLVSLGAGLIGEQWGQFGSMD